jgi:hypothetical protein
MRNPKQPHQFKPTVTQRKTAVTAPTRKQPIAPPVYRPQAKPLLQKKQSTAQPVYRPLSVPKVLQTRQVNPAIQKKETVQPSKPSVYRPLPVTKVAAADSKTNASVAANLRPPHLRPNALAVQRTEAKKIVPPKVMLPSRPSPKIPTRVGAKTAASSSLQLSRSAAPVLQLKRRARGKLHPRGWYTQSKLYFVADNNKNKLYSYWGAPAPQPASLFIKSWEFTSGLLWSTWTPKVQFLTPAPHDDRPQGSALREYRDAQTNLHRGQGSFIFGKNDCSNFATVLSSLITEETGAGHLIDVDLKGSVQIVRHGNVGVGTMLKHRFVDDDVAQYHAATVVAVDGKDLVTLEADVGKPLTRPEFHIRAGVYGFVRNNDPGRAFGDEVRVVQAPDTEVGKARGNFGRLTNPEFEGNEDGLLEQGLIAITQ